MRRTVPTKTEDIDEEKCLTCEAFKEFATLGAEFSEKLAGALAPGIWLIFSSLVGLWILWQALMLIMSKVSPQQVMQESAPLLLATVLLGSQGTELVLNIYKLGLSLMSGTASVAFSLANNGQELKSDTTGYAGMEALVLAASNGVGKVFDTAGEVASQGSILGDFLPWIFAIAIILPYIVLLFSYFGQVVIAMFRLMALAALSPFLLMGLGFGWGRSMAFAGLRTALANIVVMFASTSALSLAIYGVSKIDTGVPSEIAVDSPNLILLIGLGWMGSALMTEGVSIANSVTQSALTNTAAGIMTAAGTGTAMAIGGAAWSGKSGAANAAMTGLAAARHPVGAAGRVAEIASEKVAQFKSSFNKFA